jgi:hypothetical protein
MACTLRREGSSRPQLLLEHVSSDQNIMTMKEHNILSKCKRVENCCEEVANMSQEDES